jgi:hypothetical protein
MTRATRFALVLLSVVAGIACQSQSDLLRERDGGAAGSGGIAGARAGSGGASDGAGTGGGAGTAGVTAGTDGGAAGSGGRGGDTGGRGGSGGTSGNAGSGNLGGVSGTVGLGGDGGIGGRGGFSGTAGATAGTGGRGGANTGVAGVGGTAGVGGPSGSGGPAGRGGASGTGGVAGRACLTCRTTILPIAGEDVVYNAARREIYVSVSGDAPANANTIVVVDPVTASVVSSIPIGSNPKALAVSEDGSTLWVGIDGAHAFRKVTLASAPPAVGPLHHLPRATTGSFYTARGMVALPGAPQSVAMSLVDGSTNEARVFDDGVSRPTVVRNDQTSGLLAAGPPGLVFGGGGFFGGNFLTLSVSASGIAQTGSFRLFLSTPTNIVYSAGRVYSNGGDAIDVSDPAAPFWAGRLFPMPIDPFSGWIAVRDAQSLLMLSPNSPARSGAVVRVLSTSPLGEIASVAAPAPITNLELEPTYVKVVYAGADAVALLRGHWGDWQLYVKDLVVIHDPAFGTPTGGASGGSGGLAGSGGASGSGGSAGSGGAGGSAADPCPGCSFVTVPAYGSHLAYDAGRNLVYMTGDGTGVPYPSSIVTVNPATGGVTSIVPVGNYPQPLALSDDGSVLWVGLAGDYQVRRVTPGATPVPGPAYPLPMLTLSQPAMPNSLVVLPGTPSSIAVSVFGTQSFVAGVFILDDGVPRANFIQPPEVYAAHLTNGPPGYLIGLGIGPVTPTTFVTFRLDTMGATYASHGGLVDGNNQFGLTYSAGKSYAYGFQGEVIDLSNPDDPMPAGKFAFDYCSVAIRSARRVLMLCPNPPALGPVLRVLDTATFAQVGSVALPDSLRASGPPGWADFAYVGGDAVAVLPWDQQQLQIVHAPLIGSQP